MVTSGFQTGASFWPNIRRLWNFQTREELKQIHLPSGSARGFAFSYSGKFLALHCDGGNDVHEIHIYDTETWELETVIPSEATVHSLSFSPDEKTLATIGHSDAVLWDWRRCTILHKWPVQSGFGRHDIAFFPDSRRLAIGGANELKIVDVATGHIVHRQPARGEDTRLAISPDSRYVAIGSGFEISEIGLLNTDSWEQEPPLKGHSAWVTSIMFTPDGKLVSASADQTLRVWDMNIRITTRVLRGHQSVVNFFSLTSDGARAVSVGQDKRILEWDLNAPLSPYIEHLLAEPAGQVVFSIDSRSFYMIDRNGSVGVWDANTFSKQHSLSQELGLGSRIILSPKGDRLIAGTKSGDLWVLDAGDLQIVEHRNV
jgi:WD40 repeat protein